MGNFPNSNRPKGILVKLKRFAPAAAILAAGALTLSACGGSSDNGDKGGDNGGDKAVSGNLIGGGASSQEAAMTAWAEGVKADNPKLSVNYDPVGSGSGRKGFLGSQYSFAGSDAALKDEELEEAKKVCGDGGAFHVPAYISPIAVAYNLPDVDEVKLDAETIAKIFAGEIKKWNDDAIAKQNEGVELPDMDIVPVHRADDSGTTENFTAYLAEAAGDAWKPGEIETWPKELGGESAQQTSGVVSLTQQKEGAITYADASQVGELGTVSVKVGEEYVPYSAEAAAKMVDASKPGEAGAIELDRKSEESGVYPIVLVSYHIYCKQYQDQETADLAKAFASYVVSEKGQKDAEAAAGNAPISQTTRDAAMKEIDAITAQG